MRHQQQREVEWRDGQHRPYGKPLHDAPAPFVALGHIQWNRFAAQPDRFLSRRLEGKNGPLDFDPRRTHRLACLRHDELGKTLLLLDEGSGNVLKDFFALPPRQRACTPYRRYGVGDRLARVLSRRKSDSTHQSLVPRRTNFHRLAIRPFLATQQEPRLAPRPHLHRAIPRFILSRESMGVERPCSDRNSESLSRE